MGQAAAFAKAVRRGARAHRASPLRVAVRARRARSLAGYEYEEALGVGLLDPRLPASQVHLHASKDATLRAQRRVNPEPLSPLTEEKAIFYRHVEALGLPAPRLLAIVGRAGGWARDAGVLGGAAAFAAWAEGLPERVVLKPSAGYHGQGVRVLRRRDGLLEGGGEAATPAGLYEALRTDPVHPLWVLQEHVTNAPEIAALGSPTTLQTVRMVTLVGRDGAVEVIQALLRLAAGGADVDNYRSGTTGNGIVEVGAEGLLGPVRTKRPDGCGFRFTPDLPGTGRRVEGAVIPHWDAALALVSRAAPHFLPARTIGWDVAITGDGPLLIEGNMWWDPPGTPDQAASLAKLAA